MILIADDDRLARFALRSIIEEIDPDITIIEATDGDEAIAAVTQHRPSIAFVDITMPFRDGLSAIRVLRDADVDTRFVVVTAHADFDYARQGIELRIDDYLLKPVDPEQLASLLQNVFIKIHQDTALISADFHNQVVRNYQLWEEEPPSGPPTHLDGPYCDATLFLNTPINNPELPTTMAKLLKELHQSDARSLFGSLSPATIKISDRELRIVLRMSATDPSQVLSNLNQLCERMSSTSCCISGLAVCGASLEEVFLGAQEFVERPYLQLLGRPFAIIPAQLQTVNDDTKDFVHTLWELVNLIDGLDDVRFTQLLQQLRNNHADLPRELLLADLIELISAQLGESIAAATLSQFYLRFTELRREVTAQRALPLASKIGKIQEHISQNYAQPMTLASIARRYDLTPNYLSTLFRETSGLRFSEYLTQIRMSVALEIIKSDPHVSIKELAALTGYANPRQFSDTFRRYTGVLPSQYDGDSDTSS